MPRLPGLNYGTPLTIDDLGYLETTYTNEFRTRTLAVLGSYRAAGASDGILAESDPVNAVDATDPLYVARNPNDTMTVDIAPGVCVTPSGMRVALTTAVTGAEMARTTVGAQNIVLLEHIVVSDEDTITKTRYNTSEARRTRIASETSTQSGVQTLLQVVSIADWQNDTTYPPDRRADIVVIAVVSVVTADNTAGQQVAVDLSRNNVTENRPWFSPVDIAHRSQVGTGAATTPHQLGLNDLSQGDLTLYDQLINHGMIVGRDLSVPGVPGTLCFEVITPARILTDTTGEITGTLSQLYVELTRFPVRLLGAYSLPDPTNELLVRMLPRTNLLLVSQDDVVPGNGMRVLYTTVDAAEPLATSLINDELHVRQPSTASELLISGGRGYTTVQPRFLDAFSNERARISIGGAPAIPKRYRVFADATGTLLSTPQHILCATKLDDLGTGVFQFENEMLGDARLRVGLQDTTLNVSTSVQLRLTGTDTTGNTVTEDTTFTFANYTDPVVGACEETSTNFLITETVFRSATSIQVIDRVADGPGTAVCVWAELDPSQTEALRDVCPVANLMWDGARICRVQDARPVNSRLALPSRTSVVQLAGQATLSGFAATGAVDVYELLSDDLRDPRWFRTDDPLRLWKFNDGIESSNLPTQPGIESAAAGLTQDIYTSQAIRLPAGTGRSLHVTLYGAEAQRFWLNATDGLLPNVEYRWATTGTPGVWTSWAVATPLDTANGANFRIPLTDDTAFKLQLRLKGSLVGVTVLQYRQLGGSQSLSGTRTYTAQIQAGQTHQVALPFGQTLASANYRIVVSPYTDADVLAAGNDGVFVVHVERYLDHAVAHLTAPTTISSTTWRIAWSLDLNSYDATTAEGFGDTVV